MKNVNAFRDFLKQEVNLNQSRIDTLDQKIDIINSLLRENLDGFRKYERQGSYALRTMIKPVKDDDEVDADLLIYVNEQPRWGAMDYIDALYNVFRHDSNYRDIVHRKTRCVLIDYAGDFHLDLVPVIERSDGVYVCNYKENTFEKTDGTGFRDWYNGKSKSTNGELKRVTRVLKFLRDHKDNLSIKSILLARLLGNFVYESDSFDDTPTALKTVIERLNEFLKANPKMPLVTNPVLPGEDFNRHWDQAKYENFREKVGVYAAKILDAYNDQDHNESVRKWRKVFGEHFGAIIQPSHSREQLVVPRKPYAQR